MGMDKFSKLFKESLILNYMLSYVIKFSQSLGYYKRFKTEIKIHNMLVYQLHKYYLKCFGQLVGNKKSVEENDDSRDTHGNDANFYQIPKAAEIAKTGFEELPYFTDDEEKGE